MEKSADIIDRQVKVYTIVNQKMGRLRMIAIRVDANNIISTGALMRCITVADALKNEGEDVLFITADDYADSIFKDNDCKYISLGTDYAKPHSELDRLVKVLKDNNIIRLLLDSNRVDQQYINSLSEHVNITYFDDMNKMFKGLTNVIQYSPFSDWTEYLQRYFGTTTSMYIGSVYAPLRSEFSDCNKVINKEVKSIMITTGGTDNRLVAYKITEMLANCEKLNNVRLHLVVGYMFDDIDMYDELAGKYDNIVLHKNKSRMSDIMLDSDIAISAGGTTLLELCSCGVPTVVFAVSDNQYEWTRQMINYKYMVGVGDIRLSFDRKLNSIKDYVLFLSDNYERRLKMSENMKKLVDGNGAARIAKGILMQ